MRSHATDDVQHQIAAILGIVTAVIGNPDVHPGLRVETRRQERLEIWTQHPDDLRPVSSCTKKVAADKVPIHRHSGAGSSRS
jgi:hypothetical protein